MTTHSLTSRAGDTFELEVGSDGRITGVDGPWPAEKGVEVELLGPLPSHEPPINVPARILEAAAARGHDVCFHDKRGCKTCYCDADGNVMRCVGEC